jgi:DNA-binding NarL/FixJ family response regulator
MTARSRRAKAKILIVDDHPIVREGLASLINGEPDLKVCGEAEDVPSGLAAAEKLRPDLVVADLSFNGRSGLDLIKGIRGQQPDLPILVLSVHDESAYAERVLQAGANGYIMKEEAAGCVIAALRRVLAGEIYLSANMSSEVLKRVTEGAPRTPLSCLTDRELDVYRLIGRGYGVKQMAEELNLSRKTVETYRARIREKLGLSTSGELLQHAIRWVADEAPGRV